MLLVLFFTPSLYAKAEPELNREWVKQVSNTGSNYAATTALAKAPDQTLVAVGFSRGPASVSRIVTTKFSRDGAVVWQQEFSGITGSAGESPDQLHIDGGGNIYISGNVMLSPDVYDFLVIKYLPDGRLAWAKHLNGGQTGRNLPAAMAVNQSGDVYITGQSAGGMSLTVKLSSGGDVIWSKTYDGPSSGSDPAAQSITLDADGNPIISGTHFVLGEGRKLFVLKYNGQNGQQLFISHLNEMEAAHPGIYTSDKLLTDASGNIYVAGSRAGLAIANAKPLLIKLNSQGAMLWSRLDNMPSYNTFMIDAELDTDGNLVILGSSQNGRADTEVYLSKYNPAGSKVWGDLIEDATGELSYPRALAISANGHIAITGMVRGMLPEEVGDLFTYLYTGAGDQVGADRYDANGASDTGSDIVFDAAGKLYVAGHSSPVNGSNNKLLLVKYGFIKDTPATQLTRAWAVTATGLGTPNDVFFDSSDLPIAVTDSKVVFFGTQGQKLFENSFRGVYKAAGQDQQHNIYVLSDLTLSISNSTFLVTKFSSSGQQMWEYQYDTVHLFMNGNDLAVSPNGDVFIASTIHESSTDSYVQLIKLQAGGATAWQLSYEGFGNLSPKAAGIVLDEQGDVYVTGNDNTQLDGRRVFLLKYNGSNGSKIWERHYKVSGGPLVNHYDPQQLFIHSDGSLYVAGTTQSCCISHPTAFVLKTDAEGNLLWESRPGDSSEIELLDASLSPDGSIAVIGTLYNPRTGVNTTFVSKISSEGEQAWFEMVERLMSVLALENGMVAVTGTSNTNLFVYLYNEQGIRVQQDSYGKEGDRQEMGTALAMDVLGNLYVGGTSGIANSETRDLVLIKYGSSSEEPCNIPVAVRLYLPPMAKRVGWQVRTTADFRPYILGADHGVRWTWGDGSLPTIAYTAHGTSRITGEHTYQKAGIYTIGLDFEESCLKPTTTDYSQQMVIYDPEAGYVTGNGELAAPANFSNKKLTYSFSVRYPNQHSRQPVGSLHVMLGDMGNMVSKTLDWLVIDGNRAAIQGTAAIKGKGNYRFVATLMDGGSAGPNDAGDGMRLQVWDSNAHGKLIFDNHSAGSGKLDLMQHLPAIEKGQIIINGSNSKLAANGKNKLEHDAGTAAELTAYPNPFSTTTTIRFKVSESGLYEAALYDAKGAFVCNLQSVNANASETLELKVDGSKLKEGLYFVRLTGNGSVQTVKLLLQR
ncbi:hypothetical protein GCM10027293_05070 [Pontibacter aydingkolensis]